MTPAQLAQAYVRCFCEAELEALETLLSEDFSIAGPLYTFNDRSSFMARLRTLKAPPASWQIRHCIAEDSTAGNEANASVFFDYRLGKIELLMAMNLSIRNGQIHEALLVFDTARLPSRSS